MKSKLQEKNNKIKLHSKPTKTEIYEDKWTASNKSAKHFIRIHLFLFFVLPILNQRTL